MKEVTKAAGEKWNKINAEDKKEFEVNLNYFYLQVAIFDEINNFFTRIEQKFSRKNMKKKWLPGIQRTRRQENLKIK